ncbi:hypothetical protein BpHYR1_007838 [Brachionus plicatilis]|uniref:Uncharacterized protein n=1 Tax=Brachionus plicatilis TaxID=10195 RepID=A0A3M7S5C2_BRAPC|nr:hypothetical protein BpHYR1_007838 [Brachionus plicatilis]
MFNLGNERTWKTSGVDYMKNINFISYKQLEVYDHVQMIKMFKLNLIQTQFIDIFKKANLMSKKAKTLSISVLIFKPVIEPFMCLKDKTILLNSNNSSTKLQVTPMKDRSLRSLHISTVNDKKLDMKLLRLKEYREANRSNVNN